MGCPGQGRRNATCSLFILRSPLDGADFGGWDHWGRRGADLAASQRVGVGENLWGSRRCLRIREGEKALHRTGWPAVGCRRGATPDGNRASERQGSEPGRSQAVLVECRTCSSLEQRTFHYGRTVGPSLQPGPGATAGPNPVHFPPSATRARNLNAHLFGQSILASLLRKGHRPQSSEVQIRALLFRSDGRMRQATTLRESPAGTTKLQGRQRIAAFGSLTPPLRGRMLAMLGAFRLSVIRS
jgi:hypothetical protein